MSTTMTAADVKAALAVRHGVNSGSGAWVGIEEAFCGWRSAGGGIDYLAIGAWKTASLPGLPSAGKWETCPRCGYGNRTRNPECDVCDGSGRAWDASFPVVAYEVKVSRSDYRREVDGYTPGKDAVRSRGVDPWPAKARWALKRSHYYMFATPAGLLRDYEIKRREPWDEVSLAALEAEVGRLRGRPLWLPPEAGLIEVDGRGCVVKVKAPRRPAPPPLTRPEMAELLRHSLDPNSMREARLENARLRGDVDRLYARLREAEGRLEAAA